MNLNDFIRRADELITKADRVLQTERSEVNNGRKISSGLDLTEFYDLRSLCLSFFSLVFGDKHHHYTDFNKVCGGPHTADVKKGLGILNAARAELSGGWLTTSKWLVTAEIFSDFLEMADYLLAENYKDPAAVVGGSVLEEHLRQLCIKNTIEITHMDKAGKAQPNKADALNADLSRSSIYNKLDQKNVMAWLDLRNKAAHGRYNEYTKDQVTLMLTGIRDFITRNPA